MWFTEKHDKSYREDTVNANHARFDHKLTETIKTHHKDSVLSLAFGFMVFKQSTKTKVKHFLSYYTLTDSMLILPMIKGNVPFNPKFRDRIFKDYDFNFFER